MIVVGVDVHKRSHTLAVLDGQTGAVVGRLTVAADERGHLAALRLVAGLGERGEVVWAIEDCRHVSGCLEQALLAAGQRVVRVSPALTGVSRRGQREAGKSDAIDAVAIARAVLRDGPDSFPAAFLDQDAMEIRLLSDHRRQLVAERTRQINRLRGHLVCLDPALEGSLAPRALTQPALHARLRRRLARLPAGARQRIAVCELSRVRELTREIDQLKDELDTLTQLHNPALRAQAGCGPVNTAILIGHTAGAQRFATDAKFARQTGTAPIPASSGNTHRHRLDRGGDRQLNYAIHIIALYRARTDPTTRAYLDRQHARGKTHREAIRSLKRHIARHIWRTLYAPNTRSEHSLTPAKTELLLT